MLNVDSSMPALWRYGTYNYSVLKTDLIKFYLKHSLPEIASSVIRSVLLEKTNRKKSRVHYRKSQCLFIVRSLLCKGGEEN